MPHITLQQQVTVNHRAHEVVDLINELQNILRNAPEMHVHTYQDAMVKLAKAHKETSYIAHLTDPSEVQGELVLKGGYTNATDSEVL